jgi:hypothetical protein
MMVSVWAGANLLWLTDKTAFLPLLTLPVAVAGYAFWYDGRQRWQAWFACIMAARLGLHVIYPGSGSTGEIAHLHIVNLTFVAALVAISWKGGISDAVGAIGRYGGLFRFHRRISAMARHPRPADARP